jgi:hypothetical protein
MKFGKHTRSLFRIIFYSIGLTVFLNEGWIMPKGNFFMNIVAGLVLYLSAWFAAFLVSVFLNSEQKH